MKKKLTVFLVAVLALSLVMGTLAFYTSSNDVDNRLKTTHGGDALPEEFKPEPLEPGKQITKKAGVQNTGEIDLVVRVKLDEYWWRDANNDNVMQNAEQIKHIASSEKSGSNIKILTVSQPAASSSSVPGSKDGIITNDGTVVTKQLDANFAANWTYNDADGYWYYNKILKPNETAKFLESITGANDMDQGLYETTKYYTFSATVKEQEPKTGSGGNVGTNPATQWVVYRTPAQVAADEAAGVKFPVPDPVAPATVTYSRSVTKLVDSAKGYADAVYDLVIAYDTCQATWEAVDATWANAPAALKTDDTASTGWKLPKNA